MADRVVDTNWRSLSLGKQIRHLEAEGYLIMPNILSSDHIAHLREQLRSIKTVGTDYTDKKQVHNDIQ